MASDTFKWCHRQHSETRQHSRLEADELPEVLRRVATVPLLRLTPLLGPGHVDLLGRRLRHLLLFIGIQAAHAHQRVPVLHQLGLHRGTDESRIGRQI